MVSHWLVADVVRGNTQTLVRLVGAIDIATIPYLRDALEPEILPSATVILDLAGVNTLGTDGVRVINEAQQALRPIGGKSSSGARIPSPRLSCARSMRLRSVTVRYRGLREPRCLPPHGPRSVYGPSP